MPHSNIWDAFLPWMKSCWYCYLVDSGRMDNQQAGLDCVTSIILMILKLSNTTYRSAQETTVLQNNHQGGIYSMTDLSQESELTHVLPWQENFSYFYWKELHKCSCSLPYVSSMNHWYQTMAKKLRTRCQFTKPSVQSEAEYALLSPLTSGPIPH